MSEMRFSMIKCAIGAAVVAVLVGMGSDARAEQDPNRDMSGLPITGGFQGYGPSDSALGRPRAVRPSISNRLEEPAPVVVERHATIRRRPPPPAVTPRAAVVTRQPEAAAVIQPLRPVATPVPAAPRNLSASVRATMPQAPSSLDDGSSSSNRVVGPGPRPQQVAIMAPPEPKAEPQVHLGVPPDDFPEGILIDVSDRTLYYIQDGAIQRTMRVAVPRANATRIFGDTEITRKRPNPTWRPTPRMLREDPSLPEVVPPGPNNPLGSKAMNTGWQYIAIHGTSNPRSIGRMASSGCYRLLNEDVEWLYRRTPVGMPVRVRR
ncbi:MAG: hypothetical protein Alpg2KO_05110 [Alphaproteobacteria bacterium]